MIPVPWWSKIAAKVVLSRVPISYRFFAGIGIFKHGHMQDPDYAISVFSRHLHRSEYFRSGREFVGLELGTGDSIASAIIANAHGATTCYLVDAGRFAVDDIGIYESVVQRLQEQEIDVASIDGATNLDEVLARYGGIYLVNGLQSLQSIPDCSVDFVWSQAVLEHVRLHEFDETMEELYRIVRPGGTLSHRVDLKDHLGGALNNRRLSSKLWEADWMAQSGFYTNRITCKDMIRRFEEARFLVESFEEDRWESLPTPQKKMAAEFATLPSEELLVSGFDVVLRRQ